MNLKKISIASLAVFAVSANASLFVTTSGGTSPANEGATDGDFVRGVQVLQFVPSANVNLTQLGVFDHSGDGFADFALGFKVELWASAGGDAGTSLASHVFTGTAETLSAGSEWRLFTLDTPVALTSGQTYAISVTANNGNNTVGLFNYPGGGIHAYGDNTLAGNGSASYSGVSSTLSIINDSTLVRNAGNIFSTAGALATDTGTRYRFVTANFEAVPEPSTYALVAGVGMIGFGLWRRRSVKA